MARHAKELYAPAGKDTSAPVDGKDLRFAQEAMLGVIQSIPPGPELARVPLASTDKAAANQVAVAVDASGTVYLYVAYVPTGGGAARWARVALQSTGW